MSVFFPQEQLHVGRSIHKFIFPGPQPACSVSATAETSLQTCSRKKKVALCPQMFVVYIHQCLTVDPGIRSMAEATAMQHSIDTDLQH